MKRITFFAVFLCVGCPLLLVQKPADPEVSVRPLGPAVVWDPPPQVLSAIREKCGKGDLDGINGCFVLGMQSANASPQAVAFAKSFAGNGLAYVRAFRNVGLVDIAYIEYAFRANELDGILLVPLSRRSIRISAFGQVIATTRANRWCNISSPGENLL
jgi:hypothetical protein